MSNGLGIAMDATPVRNPELRGTPAQHTTTALSQSSHSITDAVLRGPSLYLSSRREDALSARWFAEVQNASRFLCIYSYQFDQKYDG